MDIEVKLKSPLNGEIITYSIKPSLWIEDQSDQLKCLDQNKNLNMKDLWIIRITKMTGKAESEIRKLQSWEMSALLFKWLAINDVNPTSFLELSKEELEEFTPISTQ